MDILYFSGSFDLLHTGHRFFITQAIAKFKTTLLSPPDKIVIGLKSDAKLNREKGKYRPMACYNWRENDLYQFMLEIGYINVSVIQIPLQQDFNSIVSGCYAIINEKTMKIHRDNLINRGNTLLFLEENMQENISSTSFEIFISSHTHNIILLRNGVIVYRGEASLDIFESNAEIDYLLINDTLFNFPLSSILKMKVKRIIVFGESLNNDNIQLLKDKQIAIKLAGNEECY